MIIDTIIADGAQLFILPKDPKKDPLEFDIRKLKLESAGPGIAMRYTAELTNPKPPGLIRCQGHFGPWVSEDPSDTPLDGKYVFENADLSVFKGIAGRLDSTGKFEGTLDNIVADGETRTPDFRLTVSGNPVPLQTKYHAIIDGGNGNTLLQPVEATLGRTRFVVRGGVVRGVGESGKTVALDVVFREGYIEDLMRLAMKGPKPMMRGPIDLKVKLQWPPGKGDIADKLRLSGTFVLRQARFTSATVQDKIDGLSSRAQGNTGRQAGGRSARHPRREFPPGERRHRILAAALYHPRRGCGSGRQLHVRQGSGRFPRQAAIAGEDISNHDRLEAMGAEAGRPVLRQGRRGDATPDPDRRHARPAALRAGPAEIAVHSCSRLGEVSS